MAEPTPIAWAFSRCGCVVSTHRSREAADAAHAKLLKSRRFRFGGGGPIQVNTTPTEALHARQEARRNRGTSRRTT